jgi:uncharacterized protein YgiM (DUF1202 family)
MKIRGPMTSIFIPNVVILLGDAPSRGDRDPLISRNSHVGQNHFLKIGNKYLERVEQVRYLGRTLRNQYSIHEAIKSHWKSENDCYLSVKKVLSSSLLSKNIKIKIHITTQTHIYFLVDVKIDLTFREERRVFEN